MALRSVREISEKNGHVEEAQGHNVKEPEAALRVSQDARASELTARIRRGTRDPLASPTLAKIYASQGYPELAEGIYAQIGRPRGMARPASSRRDNSKVRPLALLAVEKLLALREAARKLKGAGERATSPNETDGG